MRRVHPICACFLILAALPLAAQESCVPFNDAKLAELEYSKPETVRWIKRTKDQFLISAPLMVLFNPYASSEESEIGSVDLHFTPTPPGLEDLRAEINQRLGNPAALANACQQGLKAITSPPGPNSLVTQASLPASGQASEGLVFVALNESVLGEVFFGPNGIMVAVFNSDGSVKSVTEFATGFSPDPNYSTIVAADFNGDGKLDLAVSNPDQDGPGSGGIAILLGNGDGTFQAAKSYAAGQNPSSLAAADFNGDGKVDLAAASSTTANIVILSGKGDGTFGAPVSYASGGDSQTIPVSIAAIDLDGDGRPDLAVANQGFVTVPNSSISTLVNTGSGFKSAFNAPLPLALRPNYLAYGDFNNDGKVDLVAVSSTASAVAMMYGQGDGTFQPLAAYATGNSPDTLAVVPLEDGTSFLVNPDKLTLSMWITTVSQKGLPGSPVFNVVGGAPTGISVGDLNGDGKPDAVVTGASNDIAVLLGEGSGVKAPVGYSLGLNSPMPSAVAIGDMNNDGKPDVVAASAGQPGSPGNVSVLLGNGDGTLQPAANTPVNQNAQGIALADLNRDGKLDAVVAAYGSTASFEGSDPGGLEVLLGNGSGGFQTPQTITASGLHPEAVAVADLNGDGIPDLAAVMVASSTSGKSTLTVFLGKGDGTFQAARTFPLATPAGTQSGIAIADFNHDGKLDIAAASNGPSSIIDIMLGDGTGNFKEAPTIPVSNEDLPVFLVAADINQDGNPDLIVAHCCGQSDATYFLGNGDGTFQDELQLPSGSSPMAVAVTSLTSPPTIFSADNVGAVTAVTLSAPSSVGPGPAIASVSPSSVGAGGGTLIITVTGSGFVSGDVVLWNGTALPTTFISETELQATVIASLTAQPGPVSITVSGSGVASKSSGFTVGPSVAPSANIYYFPHLAFGGGWQTTLTYLDYSPESVTCQTAFYSNSGAPLPVPFPGGTSATRTDHLGAGADIHDQTQAGIADELLTGWAEAQCSGPIKASLLYRLYNGAVAQGEAGVNAVTAGATEFVSFAQTATGIAYANPSATFATITIKALNAGGVTVDPTNVMLPPNQHGQANLGPLLGLNNFTGSVQVTSAVPILTLLLNAEAFPVFSSLPPADLPAGTPLAAGAGGGANSNNPTTYYFPHLAFGGGWRTTLTYVNYSAESVTCQTTFYGDKGGALQVPFSEGTSSTRNDTLAAGADVHDQTQAAAAAELLTGWAQAKCTGPVKASLLYRLYNGAVAQGEAGVNAATAPATEFVSFAQTATGIAYANPSPTSATITIKALSASGATLGTTKVVLPPNQHNQANIGPLLGLNSFTGSVQVTSTVPILALLLNAEAFPAFSSLPSADLPAGTPLAP